MNISYDKLWKLMKNNKMKKSELAQAAAAAPSEHHGKGVARQVADQSGVILTGRNGVGCI